MHRIAVALVALALLSATAYGQEAEAAIISGMFTIPVETGSTLRVTNPGLQICAEVPTGDGPSYEVIVAPGPDCELSKGDALGFWLIGPAGGLTPLAASVEVQWSPGAKISTDLGAVPCPDPCPPPSTSGAPDTLRLFPYRLVLSGPETAPAGSDIAYTLAYTRVGDATLAKSIVITYPADASLLTVEVVTGAAPTVLGSATPDSTDLEFNDEAGTIRIILRAPPGAAGIIDVGFYVRGTAITYPEGTVDLVTTAIGARRLPRTGAGADAGGLPLATLVLLAAGVMLLAAAGALTRPLARR